MQNNPEIRNMILANALVGPNKDVLDVACGTLTVAHGMSRKQLAQHHAGAARNVSVNLIHSTPINMVLTFQ